jgi:hypothetical protein
MQEQWVFSSTFLPYTGEPIEFMLEDRNQPIHGTFADGIFHSRWADYDADRVASWRGSDGDPSAEQINLSTAPTGRFITTLKRLARILSGSRGTPIAAPRSHARATAMPATSMHSGVANARHIAGNQISS